MEFHRARARVTLLAINKIRLKKKERRTGINLYFQPLLRRNCRYRFAELLNAHRSGNAFHRQFSSNVSVTKVPAQRKLPEKRTNRKEKIKKRNRKKKRKKEEDDKRQKSAREEN